MSKTLIEPSITDTSSDNEVRFTPENILTTVFLVFVLVVGCLLSADECLKNATGEMAQEHRLYSPFPRLRNLRKDLPKFAPAFESFYNDHFAGRTQLAGLRNLILLRALRSSGNPLVGLSEDGECFFYFLPSALKAQMNYESFSETRLALWARNLQAKRDFLEANGIHYLFMTLPEKGTVFPERLPKHLIVRPGKRRIDQLQEFLQAHSSVHFVNAYSELISAKNSNQNADTTQKLYLLKDSHWTSFGATLVMRKIAEKLSWTMPAFDIVMQSRSPNDLSQMLSLAGLLSESHPEAVITSPTAHLLADAKVPLKEVYRQSWAYENQASKGPKVFVLHDSFMLALQPLIAECCHFVEFHSESFLDVDAVLQRKPDLVIEEKVERKFFELEPENIPEMVSIKSKTNNPDATIGDSEGRPSLANYSDRVELVDAAASKSKDGLVVKLLWRSRIPQKLTAELDVTLLDKEKTQCSIKVYKQDELRRSVGKDCSWLDTFEISNDELKNASKIGLVVADKQLGCFNVTAKNADLASHRLLLSIDDSISNWAAFEKTYSISANRTLKNACP